VSPLLVSYITTSQYTRRREQIGLQEELQASPHLQTTQNERKAVAATLDRAQHGPLTYNEIRLHNMADTAISAGFLGGSLNLVRRRSFFHINQYSSLIVCPFHTVGPRGLLPGVVTATLACSALQLLFNEVRVTRIKWMYGHSKEDVAARRTHPMAVQAESKFASNAPVPTRPPNPAPKTWSDRLLGAISYVIPLSRIPDDQFLADLRRRKAEVDQELETVEKQLELVRSHAGRHDTTSPAVEDNSQK